MMIHIASDETSSQLTNVQSNDIQPNAVDLRLNQVFNILTGPSNEFIISEDQKKHRGTYPLFPDMDGWWTLQPGSYEVVMENRITVGPGEAGWVITRSTLNRNGVFLTSGLYDSGYKGVMAGMMHVTIGPMRIKRGTRVGQFLLFKSEAMHMYNGQYGIGSIHDQKYGAM